MLEDIKKGRFFPRDRTFLFYCMRISFKDLLQLL